MKFTKSIWNSFVDPINYPQLQQDIETDVAIIGGGVTGISAAHLLARRGLRVAVLESLRVGGGTSSHSTGNLYFTIDHNLGHLKEKYDRNTIREVTASRSAAIDLMEKMITDHRLDCDFHRRPWYLYAADENNKARIEAEYENARQADIPVKKASPSDFPLEVVSGIMVPGQAQINPMRYVQELARVLDTDLCRIYENTRVKNVEENDGGVHLTTTGGNVKAKWAVHATHTPKGVKLLDTVLGPYREYGIACRAGDFHFPGGIFWGYHDDGVKFSTRLYERNGEKFVLVVGQPHKVGQAGDNMQYIRNLEAFAEKHFGLTSVVYRWGGQHYHPADLLPYIGPQSSGSKVFVATGFSTDGLVYGTLSAMIIAETIGGETGRWAELYNAHRFTPGKSAKKFIDENLNVMKQYLKDLPGKQDISDYEELKPGEGGVIEKDGQKIAAFRDDKGELSLLSAVCPHMKCIVNWNNAEQTWDCPCHASRFKTDGTVLEGPAYDPLGKIEIKGNQHKNGEA